MPETWANYGIDLHLELAGSRVRSALEAALRDAVRNGRLATGVRLPSSRDLAGDLGIARNTVADAYGQLVAEGWFEAKTGSGTWVAEHTLAAAVRSRTDAVSQPADPRYDLRAGVPAVSAFPRRAWQAAGRSALAAAGDQVLDYPDPRGLAELRTALAGYLGRARGVLARPENIVICTGFVQALALICRVLGERGKSVLAIEAYGHMLHRRITTAHGMELASLPVDAAGAVPDMLESSGAAAALLTPAHQYPLGMTLAPGRRTAFVRWAARTGGFIVEDDYDGEFRFDRQPVGAMQALAPGQVIYAGTASKSLAPGLRLGWLVVPDPLIDELIATKELSGGANGTLEQLTLATFIESGGYDRQIRQARLAYRRRRDRLTAALRRAAPAVRLTGIAAGLHAVAELPGAGSEADVVARAARHGVAVDGLRSYTAPGHEREPALVVGYGRPAEHAFTTAVGRLCAALASG
ncbi:MAG TPA: PLP-dependent aminotransferase family protein [Streptosporangiaceae bacterium]|nr:PLP-dependent aminotransferase family protein [Streptosporangiaceae bacterium]